MEADFVKNHPKSKTIKPTFAFAQSIPQDGRIDLAFNFQWLMHLSGRKLAELEKLTELSTSSQNDTEKIARYQRLEVLKVENEAWRLLQFLESLPDGGGLVIWDLNTLRSTPTGIHYAAITYVIDTHSEDKAQVQKDTIVFETSVQKNQTCKLLSWEMNKGVIRWYPRGTLTNFVY